MPDRFVTVFLCGDVMTGRGVDQILPHPGDPALAEPYVEDARTYVSLAEAVNGPIPRPVDFGWPWGDSLEVIESFSPDVRIANLETSITHSDDVALGKEVRYRMSPENIACITAAKLDVCALANNHVLDFGTAGLYDTLDTLAAAQIATAGAGRDSQEAQRPADLSVDDRGRVIVFSLGASSSGIPTNWGAMRQRVGVDLLPDLSETTTAAVIRRVSEVKRDRDVVIVSIHWGSNWGYDVPTEQVRFAHRLIDGGVDIVYGHSSHHPRPIERYRKKLILYGCGDFIDDYEGIAGRDEYRHDLRLMIFARVDIETGELVGLQMRPMQARQMRLRYASSVDTAVIGRILDQVSRSFGSRIDDNSDEMLTLRLA